MVKQLTRLKILKFRDVAGGTELHFHSGWNVVLGRNATGKTTLLHLISMALRGDFSELRDEDFDLEYELASGDQALVLGVTHTCAREGFVFDAAQRKHRGVAEVASTTMRGALRTSGRVVRFATPDVADSSAERADTLPVAAPPDPARLSVAIWSLQALTRAVSVDDLRVIPGGQGYRFDEGLGLFRNLLAMKDDAVGLPGVAGQLVRADGYSSRMIPLPIEAATWRRDPAEGLATAYHVDFSACSNLTRARALIDAEEFLATYPVTGVTTRNGVEVTELGAPTLLVRRGNGDSVSVNTLSFGQKRLFTFAWYLDANPGAVVADELVNGMHYEWIDACVEAMRGRQVFVTAQNPLLLDHIEIGSADDVARTFVLCRAVREDPAHRVLRWTHPNDEQSQEFFRAYQNGILRVHEILRTEGLW